MKKTAPLAKSRAPAKASAAAEPRAPRADAARNRERLIEVAKAAFTELGPEASLEEIARRAEVGIGTLYRHFPAREALLEAVYRREVEKLAATADRALAKHAPIDALREWLLVFVDYMATKKLVLPALTASPELTESSGALLTGALNKLLTRAIEAREIRANVQPADLMQVLAGIAYDVSAPGWRASSVRFIDIVIAGLRAA